MSSISLMFALFLTHLAAFVEGDFKRDFDVTWGDGRVQTLVNGQMLTLSLDNNSGSGFNSKNEFLFGQFDMQMKLVPGNSAGTVTTYYFHSNGTSWDEIDFEFLGNITGEPYTVHTNVYTLGQGNKEQQFHLWFDPTKEFHTYSILWNPRNIVFYVDGIPIRQFKNLERVGIPFPRRQAMKLYASLWNADQWATMGGLVKTNWTEGPFIATFSNFTAHACVRSSGTYSCSLHSHSSASGWFGKDLDFANRKKLKWVQKNYMVYNYCKDPDRFPQGLPPECAFEHI